VLQNNGRCQGHAARLTARRTCCMLLIPALWSSVAYTILSAEKYTCHTTYNRNSAPVAFILHFDNSTQTRKRQQQCTCKYFCAMRIGQPLHTPTRFCTFLLLIRRHVIDVHVTRLFVQHH